MQWNNGTIFRVYCNTNNQTVQYPNVTVDLDIAQRELIGKVFIGVENLVLNPKVTDGDANVQTYLQNYWATRTILQFSSPQLPPYIDTAAVPNSITQAGPSSRTKPVFARVPLIATPQLGDSELTTRATYAVDRVLNKDSILYEMINNPNALSNGKLTFTLLDQTGQPIPTQIPVGEPGAGTGFNPVDALSFVFVIYQPHNQYS